MNRRPVVMSSRLSMRNLLTEAVSGIIQRPGRTVMTMLGTVLGVGSFVATLGLTVTASSQIGQQFSVLRATTVNVVDNANDPASDSSDAAHATPVTFPDDADERISRLKGVVSGGVWWPVSFTEGPVIGTSPRVRGGSIEDLGPVVKVIAASPGLWGATEAKTTQGVLFDTFHDRRGEDVCVLGAAVAKRLSITQIEAQPAVFVNGRAFTVIGIMSDNAQLPELAGSIVLPRGTAEHRYGPPHPGAPAQMLIRTRVGAARLIAHEAPLALRPDKPDLLSAVPPPDPHTLRDQVSSDLAGLFLTLAGICLAIGTVGIANTTLVAVLERTEEIGLRRALGARPRHIAIQFLTESTMLGLLGGLVGTCLAVGCVLGVSLSQGWTAVLEPITVIPAPFAGAVTGLLAGLYPALRAARVEPVEALRR